jgi:hypothetical protein
MKANDVCSNTENVFRGYTALEYTLTVLSEIQYSHMLMVIFWVVKTMWIWRVSTFQNNILPPSSGRHNPEDHHGYGLFLEEGSIHDKVIVSNSSWGNDGYTCLLWRPASSSDNSTGLMMGRSPVQEVPVQN